MAFNLVLDDDDADLIMVYFKQEQVKNGYTGPCFICLERLKELYFDLSEIRTRLLIYQLRLNK